MSYCSWSSPGQGGWGGSWWREGKGLLGIPQQLGQVPGKQRARKVLLVCQVSSQLALLLIPAGRLQGKELIAHFFPILDLCAQLPAATWANLAPRWLQAPPLMAPAGKGNVVFGCLIVLCGRCSQVAPVSCPACGRRLCPGAICLRYIPFISGKKFQTQTILSDLQKTVISTFPRHYGSILSQW